MNKKKDRVIKRRKSRHLVIGAGEMGRALFEILKKNFDVSLRDKEGETSEHYDVLHIAYPPFSGFVKATKKYMREYGAPLVIVHSTVPVGTTKRLGASAVHSPIRGVHPHLTKGIRTFVKYFGGPKAVSAARYFSKLGIPVKTFKDAETTELLKILDTTYYGWNIMFAKEAKTLCEKFGVDFDDVYTVPNRDYNDGYAKLGMEHVTRPVLKYVRGKIGGHCVIPNTKLLKSWMTDTLKKRNEQYQ